LRKDKNSPGFLDKHERTKIFLMSSSQNLHTYSKASSKNLQHDSASFENSNVIEPSPIGYAKLSTIIMANHISTD